MFEYNVIGERASLLLIVETFQIVTLISFHFDRHHPRVRSRRNSCDRWMRPISFNNGAQIADPITDAKQRILLFGQNEI
jgi:hypothetical protein